MSQSSTDPADERALIARARAGDENAFGELVTEHSRRVYSSLRRFGLSPEESDEVAQEVFLRAWRGLARFEERSRFSTWLYRIAFNEAQRRLSRRPPAAGSSRAGDEDAIAALPAAIGTGPQARALDREFGQMLAQALALLPADLRTAVILRDIEGLSTEEAAAAAGVRQAAFKSRLHRGRMQLRALLEPYLRLEQAA
ncbi:MAG TPA: sigma-70 family RNA polymerase sigma factor [Solirubrobacteraceae bacterium]|jgi:RNA polymerase sigma-70 factor (ECF subfamily)